MAQFGAAYTHRGELHGTAALSAVALLLGVAFGLSTLLTPLYLIYQQHFGFSRITLTLIYAVYAIGNVAALLFLGRVSTVSAGASSRCRRLQLWLWPPLSSCLPTVSPLSMSGARSPVWVSVLPAAPGRACRQKR
jgi:hypothetical protein